MSEPSAEIASPPALLAEDAPERCPLPTPVGLFVNVRARRGREGFDEAKKALRQYGLSCALAQPFENPERLLAQLESALADGLKLAIVGGGDGTIRGVAAAVARAGATLGVLPLGTGNDFARAVGIPFDVAAAVEAIAHGTTTQVDVGLANGQAFLNACSLGLTTEIARKLDGAMKRRFGPLAYPLAALGCAMGTRPFGVSIRVNDEVRLCAPIWQLVIGNSRYQGGGHVIAPDAAPDDRQLHGYAVLARGEGRVERFRDVLTLGRVGLGTRSGKHLSHPAVVALSGTSFRVETDPRKTFNVDGELCGESPVDIQLVEAVLQVRVPPLPRLRRLQREHS